MMLSYSFAVISELNMHVLILQNNWVVALQHILDVILALQKLIVFLILSFMKFCFVIDLLYWTWENCCSWEILIFSQSDLSIMSGHWCMPVIDSGSWAFIYYARTLMYISDRFETTSVCLLCQNIDVHQQWVRSHIWSELIILLKSMLFYQIQFVNQYYYCYYDH